MISHVYETPPARGSFPCRRGAPRVGGLSFIFSLELQPQPLRDSVDEVEIRRNRVEIVNAGIRQPHRAQRLDIVGGNGIRGNRQLQCVIHEGTRPRAEWSGTWIGGQGVDQRVLANDPPERRSVVRDSIEAVVRAGHRYCDRLPFSAR